MRAARKRLPRPDRDANIRIVTSAQLGAIDAQLAAFGQRSRSTLFSFRVRVERAKIAPMAGAFYAERGAILEANVKKRDDGTYDVEAMGGGMMKFAFLPGRETAGRDALMQLMGAAVELPAGVKPLTAAEIDAAAVVATEAELEALGPMLEMQPG